jgi:hypothetical protein
VRVWAAAAATNKQQRIVNNTFRMSLMSLKTVAKVHFFYNTADADAEKDWEDLKIKKIYYIINNHSHELGADLGRRLVANCRLRRLKTTKSCPAHIFFLTLQII